jgi:hypothetical protein
MTELVSATIATTARSAAPIMPTGIRNVSGRIWRDAGDIVADDSMNDLNGDTLKEPIAPERKQCGSLSNPVGFAVRRDKAREFDQR